MKTRRRAFTMIDIIFAVLFVFVLLIVGLKFIFTSKEINRQAALREDAMLLISNVLEEYHADPERGVKASRYFDVLLKETDEKTEGVLYRLDLESEVLKENLDLLRLAVYEKKTDEKVLSLKTKLYIPESKRSSK